MLQRAVNTLSLPVSLPASSAAGDVPQWVQLLPAGTFAGRDGAGPYRLDDPQAVIAATLAAAAGADLPIDYDHQILWSRDNGRPAPAGGWMKEFQTREDGIWARVDWTPEAAARLRDREYRYLSPVFWHDADGRIVRIEHAALTNTPNLELAAIASRLQHNGGEMDPKFLAALASALGLSADTPPDKLLAAIKALAAKDKKTGASHAAMSKRLGLPETSGPEVIESAVAGCLDAVDETAQVLGLTGSTKPIQLAAHAKELLVAKLGQAQTAGTDPTKFVPMEQHLAVACRLTTLEASLATDKATTAVEAAMVAGKVAPTNKDWAMQYAAKDLPGFETFVASAPVIIKPGKESPVGNPPAANGQMGEADLAVCSRLGLPAEEYKKNLQQEGA